MMITRTLLCIAVATTACTEAVYVEPDVDPTPITARFDVAVDPMTPSGSTIEPSMTSVQVSGDSSELGLQVFVKRTLNRPEVLWVELLVEDRLDLAITEAEVTISDIGGSGALYDLQRDPFIGPSQLDTLPLGGIAPHGVSRLMIGVSAEPFTRAFTVTVRGTTTRRLASSSSPIAITPDGSEVWSVVPDADAIAVVDTATGSRSAVIDVPSHPMSLTISSDGRLVLVASAWANTVTVIDRGTRQLRQTFDERAIGREPRNLVSSPDGSRVYVSAYVEDRITSLVRRGDRYEIEGSLQIGRRPTGMSATPDGRTLFVAHHLPRGRVIDNEAWLTRIDLATWKLDGEIVYQDILNLDRAHCLADVFGVSVDRMTSEGVPNQLAGVFMNPSGNHAWIPHGVVAGVPVLERGPHAATLSPAFDMRPGELAAAFLTLLDTRSPREADLMLNPGMLDRPVSTSYMDCADIRLAIEGGTSVPLPADPDQIGNQFAAFPSGYTGLAPAGLSRFVGFSRGGRYALSLSYISDSLALYDAATFHAASRNNLTLSGSQPIGLAVTPDGTKAYVAYENSLFASVLDLSALADPDTREPAYVPYEFRDEPSLPGGGNGLSTKRLMRYVHELPDHPPIRELGPIRLVDSDPLDTVTRRGKILFSSSNIEKYPDLSAITMTACASCHPDGGSDGTLWATMEGERRTMSLAGGVRDRGWLHSSATHHNIIEFANEVIEERLGGHPDAFDVIALAKYVSDGIPTVQPPRTDPALVARGAGLYAEHCAGCHESHDRDEPELYDVGTAIDNAHVSLPTFFESLFNPLEAEILRLGRGDRNLGPGDRLQQILDFRQRPMRQRGEFKAPTLRGVHEQVLWFHDGRFERLDDAVLYMNEQLGLGLSASELTAVTEYVRSR